MPTAKNVGEPCAGEPHARIEAAAGGNRHQSAMPHGAGASRRPYISLATRRIEYIACTSKPDGRWVAQQARNLVMQLGDEHPFLFLVHDRDTKFSRAFDETFRSEGVKVIRTRVQAPNANAFAERWVRTARSDCLDRILILGRRHLEHVLRVYRLKGVKTSVRRGFRVLAPCRG
jgi:hypothetical protein